MKCKTNKHLRFFWVLLVGLGIMASAAHGALYTGGSGTEADPYQIGNANDWTTLSTTPDDWDNYFILVDDIDFAGASLTPVGNESKSFNGAFDGDGHILRNVVINPPAEWGVGLFGYLGDDENKGKISNLGVESVAVMGDQCVGGLVGIELYGTITSCYVTGAVTGNTYVGGLVGWAGDTITACYFKGTVTGNDSVGGLVGGNCGSITECYSMGTVTGNESVGGLVGENLHGTIVSCYAKGTVTGKEFVGGLVGEGDWGQVIRISFWDMETSGLETSSGGWGLTTSQMGTVTYYQNAGWSDYSWVMSAGAPPRLAWEETGWPPVPEAEPIPLSGSGTEDDPFQIETASDFALLSQYEAVLDKHIQMTADVDLKDVALNPIGCLGPFTGVFEGNGHVLENAQMNMPNRNNVALFGSLGFFGDMGEIRNLGVENVNIRGGLNVGGLVGYNNPGAILSCFTTGIVSGKENIGGLVGWYNYGNMESCYAAGDVTGKENVGGLVGYNNGNMESCYATGDVTGDSIVGGLVGYNEYSPIASCYATTTVSGKDHIGGLVGYNYHGTVSACYAAGAVTSNSYVGGLVGENWYGTITSCYATSRVTCSEGCWKSGGLAGDNSGKIKGSFWDTETSGQLSSPGGVGLTTSQMGTVSYYQDAGWHAYPWVMTEGAPPRLAWEGFAWPSIPESETSLFPGSGTYEDPYQIGTAADWETLAASPEAWGECFILTEDIDFAGALVTPVGNASRPFSGHFYGNRHVLRNGQINLPGGVDVGLFRYLGLDGYIYGLGTETITATGQYHVGGLVGYNDGLISACYVTGAVTGDFYVGGLVGYNDGLVDNCYATGAVSGNTYVGGVAGYSINGICVCYSTGAETGDSYVGGVVGCNDGFVNVCYATGAVTGDSYVGGLAGQGGVGQINNSFWDIETTGQNISAGGRGLATSQMGTVFYYQNAGWNAYGWVMEEGAPPRLSWEGLDWPRVPKPGPVPFPGSGTEDDPYLIETADDFAKLSWYDSILDKHILLTMDLYLEGMTLYAIGDTREGFQGVFDGNGHVLRNGQINLPGSNNVGLFSSLSGEIRNLGVEALDVVGNENVGGLVGSNQDGTITSCYTTGAVTGNNSVGGLVGYSWGTITSCYTTGETKGKNYVGGLTGRNYGTNTSCYAIGTVAGTNSVGGLVGENWHAIISCYSTGAVTGNEGVGGLVGTNAGVLANSFWDMEASGQAISAGGTGLTTAQMGMVSYYQNEGWNAYPWVMMEGVPPRLTWEGLGWPPIPEPEAVLLVGSGTEADPYLITTGTDFALLSNYTSILDKYLLLATDVDLTGANLEPIGGAAPFTGVFDGDGHVLKNGRIYLPETSAVGFFGSLSSGGEIRNLGLVAVDIVGGTNLGALVGVNNSGKITSCYVTGEVRTGEYNEGIGGLVGLNRGGVLTSCYADVVITVGEDPYLDAYGYAIGGLVGSNWDGTITSCYATGAVTGGDSVGGLVGSLFDGVIRSCYAIGAVTGVGSVGGLVGSLFDGAIRSCYAIGAVAGVRSVGGLVGYNYEYKADVSEVEEEGASKGTVTASYWDINTSGQIHSWGGARDARQTT